MPKPAAARKPSKPTRLDVLVLGQHPAAYLAAALLADAGVSVAHSTLPREPVPDRLVVVNPALFSLHKLLEPLRRKIESTGLYGLRFLSDDPAVSSEYRSKSAIACVASYKAARAAFKDLAAAQSVPLHDPDTLSLGHVDETGAHVTLDGTRLHPRALLVAGPLPRDAARALSIPDAFDPEVIHRVTTLKLKPARFADLGARPTAPMSLDLAGRLARAWLLPAGPALQLSVEDPTPARPPAEMLTRWANILAAYGLLDHADTLPLASATSEDLPLAGALAAEGVGNRTLLIGPAGGFYSATGEDLYPNCWSALFAVDAVRKALKQPHLQDALDVYRSNWRTTLGDYLRGPQQNLRFLLPLIYRNQVMTTRLCESILLGKAVVR